MNVTYLIGNGFDLGVGLETGFDHFLKYYIDLPSEDENIAKFKATIKKETIELWADFEKCFGEYIANFNNDTIDNYIAIYEDVLSELNKYLNKENDKFSDDISKDEKQISDWIRLTALHNIGFRPAVTDDFYNDTGYNKNDLDVQYNFLSFNYTTTIDRIIKKLSSTNGGELYSCNMSNVKYSRRIGSLIHVHGELNKNMIMGVNDLKQLPFSDDLPDRIRRRVIKPQKNISIGYKIDEQASKLLNSSNIICIYGMSIGITDTIWWDRIGKWLLLSDNRKIIYFVRDTTVKNDTVYSIDQKIDSEERHCEKLMDSLNIPLDKRKIIKKRIIVLINSSFMQMNKVKALSIK